MIRLGVLSNDAPFHDEMPSQLRSGFEVHDFRGFGDWDEATLANKCRSVEVLLTGWSSPKLPSALVEDFGSLRYICHIRGSIRHVVPKDLLAAGVIVSNWGDHSIDRIAEGALALLLCQLKQLVALNAFTKGGPDERVHQAYPPTLKGRDIGLYGFGPIGRHMARMLKPFGPRVAIYDPYAKDVPADIRRCDSLRELFATCQIVSIHCGLNDATRNSVTVELLELLPQGGILINTARGLIVDEDALAELVADGRLLAGLDVIRHETHWPESPCAKLFGAILTHHGIGGGKGYPPGEAPKEQLAQFVLENLSAYQEGRALTGVIPLDEYDLKT
jgi:phosphoglycerate dehydrogenase-like enzyme